MALHAQITGWGKAVPQRTITNFDLEKLMDTSDEWIRTRTGIAERRIAGPDESTLTLAVRAAREAIEAADLAPAQIDLIIVCTFSPEFGGMPSTASLVQDVIGATRAGAFDLNAACSGFIYGLAMAQATISAAMHQNVLVIGAETMSRWLDWTDRTTCVLFGDGAGAVLVQATERPAGILSSVLGSDGSGGRLLCIPGGGSRQPASIDSVQAAQHFIRMKGKEVYKFAVTTVPRAIRQAIGKAGLTFDDVDLVIPHQANIRIIQSVAESLRLPMARVFTNVDRYGNTSAASIPLALCEAVEQGRVREGDKVVLAGFGGGLSWGAAVIEWAIPVETVAAAVAGAKRRERATVTA
ncbi:MAG: ketoacyl-ACP synthase III [Chloroflexi bacterium]|nr:ketoacyl-ACP synthase III [Chloroflexota bacterium]